MKFPIQEELLNELKEKLKYFHPAFHSTTPEGLNARLTFLNQCVRPGDTVPIKGISDESDLAARNTTFGPPPICVLRIGDFYNCKIIPDGVSFTYDSSNAIFACCALSASPSNSVNTSIFDCPIVLSAY